MTVFIACLVLFLAMSTGHSDASYCECNTGVSDPKLQTNIDYACGSGADCSPILQNGPCYNPNTIKDHCNYAVNSYYQRKGQVAGSCDFSGTATVSQTVPNAASGCVYPSSPGNAGTPSTTNSTTSPTFGTPGSTTTTTTPGFGLGPSGNGITNTDSGSSTLGHNLVTSLAATLLLCGLICLRVVEF
ncbi:hypothetical protein ACH5RR_035952 [Cinchona calisaya]|uniref:X8 domain-containing protein n=1 Tax=Cinchona calisaya TaxID=153742 RepID=A0ABD2Y306_9GENT